MFSIQHNIAAFIDTSMINTVGITIGVAGALMGFSIFFITITVIVVQHKCHQHKSEYN